MREFSVWGSSLPPLGTEPIQNEAKRLPVYTEAPDLETPKNLVSIPRSKMYISSVLVCTAAMCGRRTKRLKSNRGTALCYNLRTSAFKFFWIACLSSLSQSPFLCLPVHMYTKIEVEQDTQIIYGLKYVMTSPVQLIDYVMGIVTLWRTTLTRRLDQRVKFTNMVNY